MPLCGVDFRAGDFFVALDVDLDALAFGAAFFEAAGFGFAELDLAAVADLDALDFADGVDFAVDDILFSSLLSNPFTVRLACSRITVFIPD